MLYSPKLITLGALLYSLHNPSLAEDAKTPADTEPEKQVETVQVIGKRQGNYTIITEDALKLVEMPGALGDPLGAISALPGVITPADGGAPAVRGSSPDDNRYFIDGMPAGYIFHAFNTSIIDENIIQDFQLYSAGFGAQYANATGAIFDIRLRDPKQQKFTTTVTASLLRAGLLLESQVTQNSAFYFSIRQGLLQFFLPEDDEPNEDGIRIKSAPTDSDYVFKYVWSNNPDNRVTANLIGAADQAEAEFAQNSVIAAENPDFAGDAKLDDSFDSQSIAWDYTTDSGTELHFIVARFLDKENINWGSGQYFYELDLQDTFFKANTVLPLSNNHRVTLGAEINQNQYQYNARQPLFVCTDFDPSCQDNRRDVVETTIGNLDTLQTIVYAIDQWQISNTLSLETGLQWNTNDYTDNNFVHPRLALSWDITDSLTFITSAGSYDRLPDTELTLPELGNPELKSFEAQHYTLGFKGDIFENWAWSAEGYYKKLSQLPLALAETEPDAQLLYANSLDGEARGMDLFLNRNAANNWYGWASLSYSQSTRTNTRSQTTVDYTLDTPLVFNVVGNYQINNLWDIGFRFTAKSGEASTEIIGIKPNPNFEGYFLAEYGQPYADRLPTYARLDVRVKRSLNWFGYEGAFFVDVLNILNRENVSEIELDYKRVQETGELYLEKDSELGLFPSIGVSFTF